jgi:ABC-2 type transport system ATP-binding protein
MKPQPAVSVRGLRKSYGDFEAVKGIGFEVQAGEVFGLLGPNGAGKTTTVEILEGLRARSAGEVSVLGRDPEAQRNQLKDRIGVCLQATNLPDKITVREALSLFGAFYSRTAGVRTLLDRLQLWDKRNSYYAQLSGGQKQRLALALAMVNDPQLLFLDEPSAGLDPQARLEIHGLIGALRGENRTVLLTTHYIEEADRLCDRVAIIDEGAIVAIGTPGEIRARTLGASVIEIRCERPLPRRDAPPAMNDAKLAISGDGKLVTASSAHPARTLVDLVKWIDQQGIELDDVQIKRPSLEDVFLELTGKSLRP